MKCFLHIYLIFFFIGLITSKIIYTSSTKSNDTPNCGGLTNPCATIEYANDVISQMNDMIEISGVFYLSKTVTLKQGVKLKSTNDSAPASIYPKNGNNEQIGIKLVTESYLDNFEIYNFKKTAILVEITNRNQMNCNLSRLFVSGNNQGISIYGSGVYQHMVVVKDSLIASNVFNDSQCAGAGMQIRDSVVQLSNLRVEKNRCNGNGGGLNIYSSQIYGDRLNITGNYASCGGGLYGEMSQLYLSTTAVVDNNAIKDGAGFHTYNCETYLDLNGIFSNNLALGDGGAIWSYMGWTNATVVLFSLNKASNGGGIFGNQITFWTNDTLWESNLAVSGSGGAMHLSGSTNMFNNTAAVNGKASVEGGAFYLFDCTTIMWNVSFVMNSAQGGGAVSVTEGTNILYNGTAISNVATSLKGGAWQVNGSTWITYSTLIHDNRASQTNSGAAIYLNVATLVATNTTFVNNVIDRTGKEEDIVCYDSSTNCYDTIPSRPAIVCLQQCDALIVVDNKQDHICHQ